MTKLNPQTLPSPKKVVETFLGQYLPRWIIRLAFYLLSLTAAALLGWMLYSNWQNIQKYQWNLRISSLLLSFAAYTGAVGVAVIVWARMLKKLGGNVRGAQHARAFCLARLGLRLPGPILHIPGRILFYNGQISSRMIWFASILELLVILVSCIILNVISIQHWDRLWELAFSLILIAVLFFAEVQLLSWLSRRGMNTGLSQFRARDLLEWSLLHVIVWIFGAFSIYFIVDALYPISIDLLPNIISAWAISGLVSVFVAFLPAGLGMHELSLGLMLTQFLPGEIAVLVAIMSRFLLMLFDILLAGIAFFLPSSQEHPMDK